MLAPEQAKLLPKRADSRELWTTIRPILRQPLYFCRDQSHSGTPIDNGTKSELEPPHEGRHIEVTLCVGGRFLRLHCRLLRGSALGAAEVRRKITR